MSQILFWTKISQNSHSAQQEWLFHYLRFRDCFAISWLYSYSTTLRSKGLVTSCACWNFFFGQNSRQLAPGKNYRPMWSETRRRQHPLTSKSFFSTQKSRNILDLSWINLNFLVFLLFFSVFEKVIEKRTLFVIIYKPVLCLFWFKTWIWKGHFSDLVYLIRSEKLHIKS